MAQQPMKRGNYTPTRRETSLPASTGSGSASAPASTSGTAWKRADEMTGQLGGGMKSLAGTIRDKAPNGPMGQMATGVADTLEQTGRYLEKEGLSGASNDLIELVRARPLESLLVCVGVGFLLGQTCGARR